jgi:hypothetical protein
VDGLTRLGSEGERFIGGSQRRGTPETLSGRGVSDEDWSRIEMERVHRPTRSSHMISGCCRARERSFLRRWLPSDIHLQLARALLSMNSVLVVASGPCQGLRIHQLHVLHWLMLLEALMQILTVETAETNVM